MRNTFQTIKSKMFENGALLNLSKMLDFQACKTNKSLPGKSAALAKQHRIYPKILGLFLVPQ
jgi:hypothetical protein